MAPICLTCGDKGNAALLIYCRDCRDSAVHHYCMNNVSPSDDNIIWLCWDCAPKDCINKPSRKSEQTGSQKQKIRKNKKQKLSEDERLVRISYIASETGKSSSDCLSLVKDVESPREVDYLEERKSTSEINTTRSTYPIQEEYNTNSLDETRKIEEVRKKRRILILNDIESSKDDPKIIAFRAPSKTDNDHVVSSQTLSGHPFYDPEDSVSAEPVLDPKWRGWFNFKEEKEDEEEETYFEILAHVSNQACPKVFDATSAMPCMLDTEILEKSAVWPKRFRASLPTAASIDLYFFPAHERDERMYDSLLDNVIQKELALKATIGNVELLIFPSYELPLPHRRFNAKYFFWGVFKQKNGSRSSTDRQMKSGMDNPGCGGPMGMDGANGKEMVHPNKPADMLNSPNLQNLSPLSMDSSQASNLLPSKRSTPDPVHISAAVV